MNIKYSQELRKSFKCYRETKRILLEMIFKEIKDILRHSTYHRVTFVNGVFFGYSKEDSMIEDIADIVLIDLISDYTRICSKYDRLDYVLVRGIDF